MKITRPLFADFAIGIFQPLGVYFQRLGTNILRNQTNSTRPPTAAQLENRQRFAEVLAEWQAQPVPRAQSWRDYWRDNREP